MERNYKDHVELHFALSGVRQGASFKILGDSLEPITPFASCRTRPAKNTLESLHAMPPENSVARIVHDVEVPKTFVSAPDDIARCFSSIQQDWAKPDEDARNTATAGYRKLRNPAGNSYCNALEKFAGWRIYAGCRLRGHADRI